MSGYQLFDTLLEPCFVLNKDLRVLYCNETAAVVCGKTARKIQRSTFRDIFQFSEPVEWLDRLTDVTEPTPYKEVRFSTDEGGEGKIQITCQPFPVAMSGADEPQWIVFVRDVTLEERLQKKYRGELEQKEGYILELQRAQAELEKYSKNLEKMVEERTAQIRQLNTLMKTLFDSLGQGFFVFDREGRCLDFSSKACETVLEGRPNNRLVWEVLKLPPNQVEGFKKWTLTLFAEMLPFEDLAPLGPPSYPHGDARHIQLEYFPLLGEVGMDGVVVVASDVTSLVEARREAAIEKENAKLILNLVNKRAQVLRFVRETRSLITEMGTLLESEPRSWDPDHLFRLFHTIKGGAASFNVHACAHEAHQAETLLANHRRLSSDSGDHTASVASLRTAGAAITREFEAFVKETTTIVGPAALSEERFVEMAVREVRDLCQKLELWSKGRPLADELRSRYLFEPLQRLLEPYDEVLRKVAESESKEILPLEIEGGDLRANSDVYGPLCSSFVHAFRNAADHGIERPDLREAAGKPRAGRVWVAISRTDSILRFEIRDDGGGIAPDRIRAKLAKQGRDLSGESDLEVIQHVFDASFSTRDQVSETSGRGVGMDAIKAEAEKLGGSCRVESVIGQGTTFIIEVPWLAEINPALVEAA